VLRGVKYEREDVLKALKTIDITRYFVNKSSILPTEKT
ncbi:lipoate--protein ligase, partial [Streptococcus pneumoniae]